MKKYLWALLKAMGAGSLCLVLISGCTGGNGKNGGDEDILNIDDVGGGIGLNDRFDLGEPVTDVQFDNVHFAYDSFQIAPSEISTVESVADYMRSHPKVKLVVEGHCDERGSREYNLSLGEHRALAVRAHLVRLGIDGDHIQTRSYGEEQPVAPGHNESAWSRNRRAEFKLYR